MAAGGGRSQPLAKLCLLVVVSSSCWPKLSTTTALDVGAVYMLVLPNAAPEKHLAKSAEEAVMSAAHFRSWAEPRLPMELFSNERARAALRGARYPETCVWNATELWDFHSEATVLHPAVAGHVRAAEASQAENTTGAQAAEVSVWLLKINVLLRARFERTLFLDLDIWLAQPAFPANVLEQTLNVTDVAFVVDAGRPNKHHTFLPRRVRRWWAAPPPMCSCLVAYRKTAAVVRFFAGAARRFLAGDFLESRKHTDQEAMYSEWLQSQDPALRLLLLPEEYYCPRWGDFGFNFTDAQGKPITRLVDAEWHTDFGWPYYCRTVHGHLRAADDPFYALVTAHITESRCVEHHSTGRARLASRRAAGEPNG